MLCSRHIWVETLKFAAKMKRLEQRAILLRSIMCFQMSACFVCECLIIDPFDFQAIHFINLNPAFDEWMHAYDGIKNYRNQQHNSPAEGRLFHRITCHSKAGTWSLSPELAWTIHHVFMPYVDFDSSRLIAMEIPRSVRSWSVLHMIIHPDRFRLFAECDQPRRAEVQREL